jgi:hypothetical protein
VLSWLSSLVCCAVRAAVTSAASAVPIMTASTSPLTDRYAARGLSASRRAASTAGPLRATRASSRAALMVSQGPATMRPTMTRTRLSTAGPGLCRSLCALRSSGTQNRGSPMASRISRHARGGGGVTLRLTPSGETPTRYSDSTEATAAASGTPTSTAGYPHAGSRMSASKNRAPISDRLASIGRSAA